MSEEEQNDDPEHRSRTPGRGSEPTGGPIEPSEPEDFGLVQVWWGDGKGKTTAALGMGLRAAGHGFRVHLLQFMKGGASSVEPVRGEYSAIERVPGFTYEHTGHYGWHGLADGTEAAAHAAEAQAGLERAHALLEATRGSTGSLDLDGPPEDGVHMLLLDEILYATERDLLSERDVLDLVDSKPAALELVLTGGHERPTFVFENAHLVTEVRKEKHPIDAGQRARKGTEY